MGAISADEVATPAVVEFLLDGLVPEGWETTPSAINLADANPRQVEVIQKGIALARAAKANGEETKEAKIFKMPPKFALSQSLQEQGWIQWHTSVQTVPKEKCAEMGISYKVHRYAVHLWMSPSGEIALAKLKIDGNKKAPLN